jgi:hypothetical protein
MAGRCGSSTALQHLWRIWRALDPDQLQKNFLILCATVRRLRTAALGRGCVKTLKSQQGGELFSLLPYFRPRLQRYPL